MAGQTRYRQISMVFIVIATLAINLFLSSCVENTRNTNSSSTPIPTLTSKQQLQDIYSLPDWWRPCLHYNNAGQCDSWDMTKDPVTCDWYNYQQKTKVTPFLLTYWRGIQVCGPLPLSVSTPDNLVDFYAGGSVEQEFECTELVKRYLYLAYKLPSQGNTSGKDVVNVYTKLQGSPFHKVVNDGSIHMVPQEGDVLSYDASSKNASGHTSIVTGSHQNQDGTWSITVIEENIALSGTATLTMGTDWKILPDNNHYGQVSSWMTPRAISSAQSYIPTPTDTPTPNATPTWTQEPSPTPPMPVPVPTPTPPVPQPVPTPEPPTPTPTATPYPIPTPTPTATPMPPTLAVTPSYLEEDESISSPECIAQPGYVSVFGLWQCTVTLTETASSQGNVSWSVSSDTNLMNSEFRANPTDGTLSPGQSVQVTLGFLNCAPGQGVNGTITFSGSSGTIPVTVSWKCISSNGV